jgi:hypothetical protein
VRLVTFLAASLFALSGCAGKNDPPGEAPAGVTATPGDGVILMSWDQLSDLTYWIFYAPGTSVSPGEVGSIALKNSVSPRAVIGLVNGTQYALVMNATNKDSAAGPKSQVVTATPRLAGDNWIRGAVQGTQSLNALAFNGGTRYVTVGDGTTIFAGDFNYGHTDPVGVAQWQIPFTPPTTVPPAAPFPFATDFKAVIYNGAFFALGSNGAVATSGDGFNWAAQHIVFPGVTGLNGLAFGDSTFFAVGNGGQIYKTSDLTQQWTQDTSGTAEDLTSIAVLNGSFFVTGSNGTLLQNNGNGIWSPIATGVTSTLRSTAFMPNAPVVPGSIRYVAVGDGGTILTSTDDTVATAWTPVAPTPLAQNLLGVTVGGATGTRFLAVGQGGAVVFGDSVINDVTTGVPVPVNPIQWAVPSQPPAGDFSSVHFFAGQYLAVGAAGANAVSH